MANGARLQQCGSKPPLVSTEPFEENHLNVSLNSGAGAEPLAQILAGYCASIDSTTPDEVIDQVGLYALDTLAVMLGGSTALSSQAILRALVVDGCAKQGTVAGAGKVASFHDAALVNGTYSHALELDDDHRVAVLHPGAVVVPAALAACEAAGTNGRRFLASVLAGYEVMCRLGLALRGKPFDHGMHPTALFGVFGAAAAAGVGMGLSAEALTRCLGIAGTQAFGLTEWRADGSWIKRLHPGRAAQSGVLAANLARAGFTGPATILEGTGGFFRVFSFGGQVDVGEILDGLGSHHHALDTAIKPYPCCRFMHGALDLAIQAHNEGVAVADISRVTVRIYETSVLTYHKVPLNDVDAQFNVPYGVACALLQGSVGLDDYTPDAVSRPDFLELCQYIDVLPDEAFTAAYPDVYHVELTLSLKSGETRRYHGTCPSGDPQAEIYAGQPGRLRQEAEQKAVQLLRQRGFGDRGEELRMAVADLPRSDTLDGIIVALR